MGDLNAVLQSRVLELAGKINRHKNGQRHTEQPPPPPSRYIGPRPFQNKVLVNTNAKPKTESTPPVTTNEPKATDSRRRAREEKEPPSKRQRTAGGPRLLEIDGITFEMKLDGSKLTRLGDTTDIKATPKRHIISGQVFLRTKTGNLLRQRPAAKPASTSRPQCTNFIKNGICTFGQKCHFAHDPAKVAICKDFLRSGTCPNREYCDLSHKMTYHRVPACHHFQRSACTKEHCRFPHVLTKPGAPVCRAFATLGYCEKGTKCADRHVFECPDYANTGHCPNAKCGLPHVVHASHERAAAQTSDEDDSEVDNDDDAGDVAEDLHETQYDSDAGAKNFSNNEDYISLS